MDQDDAFDVEFETFDNGEQIVTDLKPKAAAGEAKVKKSGSGVKSPRVITERKHKVENVNRNQLSNVLDHYAASGRTVIALNISRDIGGSYEVVSYKDEPVH